MEAKMNKKVQNLVIIQKSNNKTITRITQIQ